MAIDLIKELNIITDCEHTLGIDSSLKALADFAERIAKEQREICVKKIYDYEYVDPESISVVANFPLIEIINK